ncbi:MAG: exo-alpha-sialidase [Deltaproteobacteria bacterium]|nr:exo-alpha-sialidase [Deltaproteobacteria bacterium]
MGRLVAVVVVLAGCGRVGFDDEPDGPPAECMVTLEPGAARMNVNSERALVVAGGLEPYTFSATGPAAIEPSTGVLTTTGATGTVMVAVADDAGCTADASLTVGGSTLFYAGGTSNSVPSDQVWRSTDGITWTLAGSLPDKRSAGALLVMNDKLWWLSGTDGVSPQLDVWSSRNGVTWRVEGNVQQASVNFGAVVFDGRMWMIGGNANPEHDNVYASSDGASWTLTGNLPDANHGGSATVLGDRMFYIGGHNSGNGMLYRWVVTSNDGASWTSIGNMPTGREYAAALTLDDQIVFAGGQDLSGMKTTNVLSTVDGMTFAMQAPLPSARSFTAIAMFEGRLISAGGTDGGAVAQAIPGNAWTMPTTNFPIPRQSGKLAAFEPN